MEEEFTEAVESIIERIEKNKYYNAICFFQDYTKVESDKSGKRFCQVKLQNKDSNAADISIEDVPIMYPGSKKASFQDDLVAGDEMMLFFSDVSIEEWEDSGSAGPQIIRNPVRNQRSNAYAMPVSTHHMIENLNLPVNAHTKIALAPGKKIQIGQLDPISLNKVDLLDLVYQLAQIVAGGVVVPAGTPIGVSTKGLTATTIQTEIAKIADIT